jgi:signal transduction histidine kinase
MKSKLALPVLRKSITSSSAPDLKSLTTPPPCLKPESLSPENSARSVSSKEEDEHTQKMLRHVEINNTISELDSITSDSSHSVGVAISILNDLLNYEKLQTNVLEMFKERVPCALIKTVIDEFHVEASYFKVRLIFKTQMSFEEQSNICMCADRQKICQVVRNFVSNALKFTPEGGSVTVTVTLEPLEEGKEKGGRTSKEGNNFVESGVMHVGIRDTG